MAELSFNAATVDPQTSFDPIPQGQYLVMVIDSTIAPTKNGNGQLLKLTHEVVEPQEFKGRKIFDNINIQNQNKVAEEIGQRQLSSICHAVNQIDITETAQLHNIPFGVKVVIEEQQGYQPRNQVKGYYNSDGSDIKGGGQAAPAQAASRPAKTQEEPVQAEPAPAAGSTPPWQRQR